MFEIPGLVFVSCTMPGIRRKGTPPNFYYTDKKGQRLTNPQETDRIKELVIPPSWTDVWISPKENGHLQAAGKDQAGRKQYLYHRDWIAKRADRKYLNLLDFGKALPRARKQIAKDLRRKNLDERKVLAICLQLMQKTLIRIGNEVYHKNFNTYGLSTLKDRHFRQSGNQSTLRFVGKKGVKQELAVNDKSLIRLIKKCKEIPGQDLFQYYTADNQRHPIDSGMINNYIREITEGNFTAKDFRTWGGTLEAFRQLASCAGRAPDTPKPKAILDMVNCVAEKLGNTPSVCKKSYIYPVLLDAYKEDKLQKYFKRLNFLKPHANSLLQHDERVLLQFLKQAAENKNR